MMAVFGFNIGLAFGNAILIKMKLFWPPNIQDYGCKTRNQKMKNFLNLKKN